MEIISENTVEQDLIIGVRMKYIENDILEDLLMSLRTSAEVTEGNVSSGVAVNGRWVYW